MQHQQQQHLGFEEPPSSSSSSSSSAATLLIRHLPEAIPEETLFRLLSHYGASSVRSCSPTSRMRNCAFVDFQNEGLAYQAQRQLNGLRFLGKVLKVERATSNSDKPLQEKGSVSVPPASTSSTGYNPTKRETQEAEVSRSEPIAPRLGVDYCFPPHLEYAYPPPDGNILTNIVNALIAVPRFYTQVLHLMNKMNIPAPFRMALPSPPLPPAAPVPCPPPPPPQAAKPPPADISSDESEMESSDEEASRGASRGKKRVKRESILGPAVDKGVSHEDVGLKQAILVPKEMQMIKKKNPLLHITISQKFVNNEPKEDSATNTTKEEELPETESSVSNPFASREELERGKLPPEELLSLPMFKNYTTGTPAPVLYIKNLAKDIVTDDFYYIFGSFFGSIDAAKSGLSVKLMQEGRMRGQAFVTFPSVEQSQYALNLVNGYVFKGKPMIIQFGRNPAAAKAT